jgi:ElaA protein
MTTCDWRWLAFDELSGQQVYDILRLRGRVFIVEQACPYLDPDGVDPFCWHGLGRLNGALVATARVVPPGIKYAEPSIGRVVSAPEVRRMGVGWALMREAIAQVEARYPGQAIRIGAQQYLAQFYGALGFVAVTAPYDEDGIPHLEMLRAAPTA